MKQNVIKDKSYIFALDIIRYCRILQEQKEYVLSKQLLRSGTSIGANVEEGCQAQSRADFIHKMSLSLKEASESHYWLRLLKDAAISKELIISPLLDQAQELKSILISIIKSSKGS